jgi:thioredoxin reductase (NADPH)
MKPVLLTVDDDPEVLSAIQRDLVSRAASGIRKRHWTRSANFKNANEPVALLLVDQRMPHMTGVAFLGEAIKL